jgi:hypothetical protein
MLAGGDWDEVSSIWHVSSNVRMIDLRISAGSWRLLGPLVCSSAWAAWDPLERTSYLE